MQRVFADMDGVLVDFDRHMRETGMSADEIKRAPGAYRAMRPMPGAIEAVGLMERWGFDVWIATKPPTGSAHAYSEKAEWVYEHLPALRRRIVITHEKGFLGDEDDWLVDDRPHKASCFEFAGHLRKFGPFYRWTHVLCETKAVARSLHPECFSEEPDISPDELRIASLELGDSKTELSLAARHLRTDDVLLAAGYAHARTLAVSVQGDREAWNVSSAKHWRDHQLSLGRIEPADSPRK